MDSLSIKRLRNWEGDKELKKRGIDPRTWKRDRKEARLFFQAEIPGENGQPETKLTCTSRIFQCSSCKYNYILSVTCVIIGVGVFVATI